MSNTILKTEKSLPKVLAVIVLYHCSLKDSKAYHTLFQNRGINFFVHLNSVDSETLLDARIYSYQDNSNPGVSLAYNRAAEYATQNGYDYLLLADQDSEFPDNFLTAFYNAQSTFPQEELFFPEVMANKKMISPAEFKWSRAWYAIPKPQYGVMSLNIFRPVNTGMLINLKLFNKVGGFNTQVFLDYSDFYFIECCLKFKLTGVFFSTIVIGELSDFESYSFIRIWKRYFMYLHSTAPLFFKKGYSLLPLWWILKLLNQLKRSILR